MITRSMLACLLLAGSVAVGAEEPVPAARLASAATPAPKQDAAAQSAAPTTKALSGMSVLGNQEAPKSLVIVPWKSSRIGDPVGLQRSVDDARQPVDREVFMRELGYYELRTR
jgi:hypothetical protein